MCQALRWCFFFKKKSLVWVSQQIFMGCSSCFRFVVEETMACLEILNNLPNFTELGNCKFKFWRCAITLPFPVVFPIITWLILPQVLPNGLLSNYPVPPTLDTGGSWPQRHTQKYQLFPCISPDFLLSCIFTPQVWSSIKSILVFNGAKVLNPGTSHMLDKSLNPLEPQFSNTQTGK